MYDKVKLSTCCNSFVFELDTEDGQGYLYECNKCERGCNIEEVCEFCLGTGETDRMEQVYKGEPYYAPIGTEKCICQY